MNLIFKFLLLICALPNMAMAQNYRAKYWEGKVLVSNGRTHYLLDPELLFSKLESNDEVRVKIYGTEIWLALSKTSVSVSTNDKTTPFYVLAPINIEAQKRGKDYRTLGFSTANRAIYYPPRFCISCATSTKLNGSLLKKVSELFKKDRVIASFISTERNSKWDGESYESK